MMELLTPLGLLGLIGIAVLILIYLLKPNYEQKGVSSTFVWKLSLRYRKKKLPINLFRDILILLCQIVIITAIAFILAQPFVQAEEQTYPNEQIIIIDASASMLATKDDSTRFEFAVEEAKFSATQAMMDNGFVTIILAGEDADYVVVQPPTIAVLDEKLDELVNADTFACTYCQCDIDGAMDLAEDKLLSNPYAKVVFYTDKDYADEGIVNVVNVSGDEDVNASILDCKVATVDNFIVVSVEAACYGADQEMDVTLKFTDINNGTNDGTVTLSKQFFDGDSQTIVFDEEIFKTSKIGQGIYAYKTIQVVLAEDDCFVYDNTYYVYGGEKEEVKLQYASSARNPYFETIFLVITDKIRDDYNLVITTTDYKDAELSGFDFYVFEHSMPNTMPKDGVVMLLHPDKAPNGSGLTLGEVVTSTFTLAPGSEFHPIMNLVDPSLIEVSEYTRITSSDGYSELMYAGGDPILLVKNEVESKVVVIALHINVATFGVQPDFIFAMCNIFDYFLPGTTDKDVYEIGEDVVLNARGEKLTLSGINYSETFNSLPATVSYSTPGTYTAKQTLINGEDIIEHFYVKVAAAESDFTTQGEVLTNPEIIEIEEPIDLDLLVIFAAILVAMLFIEWWLQSSKQY